jgi:hypothetical protein
LKYTFGTLARQRSYPIAMAAGVDRVVHGRIHFSVEVQ